MLFTFVKLIIQTSIDWSGYFSGCHPQDVGGLVGFFSVVGFFFCVVFVSFCFNLSSWILDKNYNLLKVGNEALKFY